MARIDTVHVPYKGGAPMMTDLIAGHIEMAIETSGSALQHIKAVSVRPLAVSTRQPPPFFPGLPTLDEAGLKGYDVTRGTAAGVEGNARRGRSCTGP
jgi:tripartite-type tricarboxylate transporter receptor subunit TctC